MLVRLSLKSKARVVVADESANRRRDQDNQIRGVRQCANWGGTGEVPPINHGLDLNGLDGLCLPVARECEQIVHASAGVAGDTKNEAGVSPQFSEPACEVRLVVRQVIALRDPNSASAKALAISARSSPSA